MKLWVVVIGKDTKKELRYVAYCPFVNDSNTLAVYEKRVRALLARNKLLGLCGHKEVHAILFVSK